jgi:hypothetical protein
MNIDEFNEKWKVYLEEGFGGLEIDDDEITEYLDREFQELHKIPGFSFSQIKIKFGSARVYLTPLSIRTGEIEKKINSMLIKKLN